MLIARAILIAVIVATGTGVLVQEILKGTPVPAIIFMAIGLVACGVEMILGIT
jgi:hypothetical protein